jgi:hypothetical protein
MDRLRSLWRAFAGLAIVFSFTVNFILVVVLLLLGLTAAQAVTQAPTLKNEVACPTISDVSQLVDDLDRATIRRTIQINQTLPVVFNLPLDKRMSVDLTAGVPVNRPTVFTLPGAGGAINGSVSLTLPKGQTLPIHMSTTVAVSQTIPVRMNVPVEIPLRETELGPIIKKLSSLVTPYMKLLDTTLGCANP